MKRAALTIILGSIVIVAAIMYGYELLAGKTCISEHPCLTTYYNKSRGQCVVEKLTGVRPGCSFQSGCLKYGCVNGECLAETVKSCCGNMDCEEGERESCTRDCRTSCIDGIMNQGETGVDCGGPCNPCIDERDTDLNQLKNLYARFSTSLEEYAVSVDRYNKDRDLDSLSGDVVRVRQELAEIRDTLKNRESGRDLKSVYGLFQETLESYIRSLDHMVSYSELGKTRDIKNANEVLLDSQELEEVFIGEYNRIVRSYNKVMTDCVNGRLNEGEERIDCGGVCRNSCSYRFNITKIVGMKNYGYDTHIKLNVSPAAINHMPMQRVISSRVEPEPDSVWESRLGNRQYYFNLTLERYEAVEIKIMQEVQLYGGLDSLDFAGGGEKEFLSQDKLVVMSSEICAQAERLRKNNVSESVSGIYGWMTDNIKYFPNNKQYSSSITYEMRVGACDEHANLFNSMARCIEIPSRKISGWLLNETSVTSHAWNEYLDGGWQYIDASSKHHNGRITDTQHVANCIVERPSSCGTTYIFTYTKNKRPEIEFTEDVFLS